MKILGVSCYYHDASAALVVDGNVVAASAEERFTRKKHDPRFPVHAIKFCLNQAGLSGSDLDLAVFHEDPATKLTRTLATSFNRFPSSLGTFLKSSREAMSAFWIRKELSQNLNLAPEKIIFTPHHMSHAAHAFLTSPFDKAAIMTIDAVGEWTSSAIFMANRKDGKVTISPVDVSPFPHSLGLVYSAFTAFLGFKVNDGECSTMALASFGKPTYVDILRRIIQIRPDGTYSVDMKWFDFRDDSKTPVTKRFIEHFGSPRSYKSKLSFDALDNSATADDDNVRYADIACSLQAVFQEAVVAYAKRAQRLTGAANLCYAGGGALNCVANSYLDAQKVFSEIYIPPDPGDGGGAMGAALYAESVFGGLVDRPRKIHPYFGSDIDEEQFESIVPHLTPERWHQFSSIRPKQVRLPDLKFHKFGNAQDLVRWVAQQIHSGRIVGWCQGRSENGPRALGNRSILIRPDRIELARYLSERVKLRASYRPYAAALTEKEARQSLLLNGKDGISHWMQASYSVRPEAASALRSASHIDGTTRAQCVHKDDNLLFHGLLVEFGRISGREAILNTSFNEAGYPLVNDSTDALMMFARTDLEILVVGKCALEKPIWAVEKNDHH